MAKRIKNNTETTKTWCSQEVASGTYHTIDEEEHDKWANDSALLVAIANEEAIVNNGDEDITDVNDAINWLKGNLPVEAELIGVSKQSTGELKVATTAIEGSSTFLVSHDFCDRTTWWGESVKVENEELEGDLTHLVYSSDHEYWIDLEHGKVPYEDNYAATYKPHIYVDGQEVTTGFTINYTTGTVTFNSSKFGHTVTATYHYENGSNWVVAPSSGKFLRMLGTEIKFSKDVELTNGQQMVYSIYVGDTCINQVCYKSVRDLIKCTLGSIHVIPSFGGLSHDVLILPYNYITVKDLKSSLNMKVKVGLKNREALSGTWGSISASCLSITE